MTDQHHQNGNGLQHLAKAIKGIKFAMLTVVSGSGHLKAHPMTTQEMEFDGDLYFLGGKDTEQVSDMRAHPQVNVSYADAGRGLYVSVAGTADLSDDQEKVRELWSDAYKTYFPGGVEDPNIQLIKIHAEGAEYWDNDGQPSKEHSENDTVKL